MRGSTPLPIISGKFPLVNKINSYLFNETEFTHLNKFSQESNVQSSSPNQNSLYTDSVDFQL